VLTFVRQIPSSSLRAVVALVAGSILLDVTACGRRQWQEQHRRQRNRCRRNKQRCNDERPRRPPRQPRQLALPRTAATARCLPLSWRKGMLAADNAGRRNRLWSAAARRRGEGRFDAELLFQSAGQ